MSRVIQVGQEALAGTGEFKNIPVGTKLRVSVFDIEETQVQSGENKGKPQFVWTAKVTEDGEFKGREIRYNNVPLYKSNNAWVLASFADAVGWPTDEQGNIEVPDNLKDVLGTELIATIGERTNNTTGAVFNRVTRTAKIKGGKETATTKKSWGEL